MIRFSCVGSSPMHLHLSSLVSQRSRCRATYHHFAIHVSGCSVSHAAMVGVLARAYPQMVPDLMAYQATIIGCYQDFEDLHWAQYDCMYRHQVAITKDLRWGRVDATLYSKCFAGKARRRAMCTYCLSDNNATNECPDHPLNLAWPWSAPQGRPQEQSTFGS